MIKSGIEPYNFAFQGNLGRKEKSHTPSNFPVDIKMPHNLSRHGVKPIEVIAKCLKVEHQHRIDDLWGGKSSECYKYEFDPNPTTIFHFLYRLRIKSNYRNTELFIANSSGEKIEGFLKSLCKIVYWTLMYLEVILIRKCRKKKVIEFAKSYMLDNEKAHFLSKRLAYYEKTI